MVQFPDKISIGKFGILLGKLAYTMFIYFPELNCYLEGRSWLLAMQKQGCVFAFIGANWGGNKMGREMMIWWPWLLLDTHKMEQFNKCAAE